MRITGGARTSSGGGSRASGNGGAARTSVNRDFGGTTMNRGASTSTTNRNVCNTPNTNLKRDVNVNRKWNLHVDVDNDWHPVARDAAFAAGAAITSAALGSVVYSVPPSCTTTVVNGVTYQECGSTWYEPLFSETFVSYVVVGPP